jgi:hypothetical protein
VKNKRRQRRRCCRQHAYNAYALLTAYPSSELEVYTYIGTPQKGNLLASFPRYDLYRTHGTMCRGNVCEANNGI